MATKRIIQVLLIEDHDEFRDSLTELLNSSGRFACQACASGEEGIDHIARSAPDVVLMDINLHPSGAASGMDGIQCTRAIKERWPAMQVMMCTVYEDDDKIFDALKAGATGYVLKRAPIEDLF